MNEGILQLSKKNKTLYHIKSFNYVKNEDQWNLQTAFDNITERNIDIFYNTLGWTPKHHIYFTPDRRSVIDQFLLTLKFDRNHLISKLPFEIWLEIFSYLTDEKISRSQIKNT
jgi:hypothetical protein